MVICFTHDNVLVSVLFYKIIPRFLLPLSPILFFTARQISVFLSLFFKTQIRNAKPGLSAGIVL